LKLKDLSFQLNSDEGSPVYFRLIVWVGIHHSCWSLFFKSVPILFNWPVLWCIVQWLQLHRHFKTRIRAYFKQDLQLAAWQCNNCTVYTARFDFTTTQIVINCTLNVPWHV